MSDSSCNAINDETLEDDAWKDSFDKLLDPRPILRELNLLKKDVRASFNMNSSVENCSKDNSGDLFQICSPLLSVSNIRNYGSYSKKNKRNASISTPVVNRQTANPFKCSLSPISAWKLRYCDRAEPAVSDYDEHFDATSNNPEIIIMDCENENNIENAKQNKDGRITKNQSEQTEISQLRVTKSMPKRKTSQRHVMFETIKENDFKQRQPIQKTYKKKSVDEQRITRASVTIKDRPTSLTLNPGKWRKSLSVWRRKHNCNDPPQESSQIIPNSIHEQSSFMICGNRKSIYLDSQNGKPQEQELEILGTNSKILSTNIWEKRVLKYCNQNMAMDFATTYSPEKLKNCRKIGEGAYGEVYMNMLGDSSLDTVLKIIPIEGMELINGEVQKTFEQILPEIVISMELCNLNDQKHSTNGFIGVQRVSCVKGAYPQHLVNLWEKYDKEKGSENDHPEIFTSEQLYIVLELSYGGKDLESFQFTNAEQSYYALQQVILTLAIGEEAYEFEHRDLHWGNVLLINTSEKHVTYQLNGKFLTMPTKGVKVTIIDYTLSRMKYDKCCLYNDLSYDEELFIATGDYQFDIYRMMRDILKNNWEKYEPKTNVFWISYLIDKMLKSVKYKSIRTKTHSAYMKKLKHLEENILGFKSAVDCAKYIRKTS